MKQTLTTNLLSIIVCLLFGSGLFAQDTKNDKVTIQITRDGKIISDTTFQLKEGQDPDAVKKVIGHVLEGDLQVISEKEGHQKMVWVTSEDDKHMWHAEDVDVRMDSVGRHEEKVMVFKGDHPGEMHRKVIVTKEPGDEETVTVISGDKLEISEEEGENSKIIIIEEKGDKGPDGHQKHVRVYVDGDDHVEMLDDEDIEWVEKGEGVDNVEVYIIKEGDGTKVVKKVKKVKVTVEEEDETSDKAEEPTWEPAPKPEKKKK